LENVRIAIDMNISQAKERFFEVYANIPFGFRGGIILVLDNEPITWQTARIEIQGNTKLGQRILEQLAILGILK